MKVDGSTEGLGIMHFENWILLSLSGVILCLTSP
jgi:hypothetical protein